MLCLDQNRSEQIRKAEQADRRGIDKEGHTTNTAALHDNLEEYQETGVKTEFPTTLRCSFTHNSGV